MPSRTKRWDRVRAQEDALGILTRIATRIRIVRCQLWMEADLETAYVEATEIQKDLAELKKILSQQWENLIDQAREKDK